MSTPWQVEFLKRCEEICQLEDVAVTAVDFADALYDAVCALDDDASTVASEADVELWVGKRKREL